MKTYQVALSFAGEQREYVERVARALQAKDVAVFYDQFEKTLLWGKDGVEFFHQLFSHDESPVPSRPATLSASPHSSSILVRYGTYEERTGRRLRWSSTKYDG